MTIEEAQKLEIGDQVKYQGKTYTVMGINAVGTNAKDPFITINDGPIGTGVKASELDVSD